jgi:mRNA interferase HigB
VRVLGQVILQRATRRHADAANAIAIWIQSVTTASWANPVELKADVPSADYVRPFTIFNIRGNTYRLITVVDYAAGLVVARAFLTHAEYDKEMWK